MLGPRRLLGGCRHPEQRAVSSDGGREPCWPRDWSTWRLAGAQGPALASWHVSSPRRRAVTERWKKHWECSALTSPEALKNAFCRRHCPKQAPTPSPACVRKGWFEELLQVTCFAIDPESATGSRTSLRRGFSCGPTGSSTSSSRRAQIWQICRANNAGLCVICLSSDLLLDRSINVSTSPGFEGLLAIFGGNDDWNDVGPH